MAGVILVPDIVEANGKTVRQNNLQLEHKIPLGTVIEIDCDYLSQHGRRGVITSHDRDCDGTPLYSVSGLGNGWSDDALVVVQS